MLTCQAAKIESVVTSPARSTKGAEIPSTETAQLSPSWGIQLYFSASWKVALLGS